MVILSRLWQISCRLPGASGTNYEGGDVMVLTLYHDNAEPHTVYNVVKVTVDNHRTVAVTTKNRLTLEHLSFRYQKDYQRLTVQVD